MKMGVFSEFSAIEYSKTLKEKTNNISITSTLEDDVIFYNNKNITKIFRMKFNDIINDDLDEGIMAPKQEDVKGLKEFVDNLDCDFLLVHCGAGVSRSAAIAAAINDYLKLGYDIFGDKSFSPNPTVYKIACKEFGIAKEKEYYEDIFR